MPQLTYDAGIRKGTAPVLHHYNLRDQSTTHASERKSMYIGTLAKGEQELWVSFDKRGDSVHPRY